MGKQKGKSNQQALNRLIAKSAAEKEAAAQQVQQPQQQDENESFEQGPDFLYAISVVAGTDWEAPLSNLTELLTGLRVSLLVGDLPTCERLLQELLHRKEYAALITCVPSLATEALQLITAIVRVANQRPLYLNPHVLKRPVEAGTEVFGQFGVGAAWGAGTGTRANGKDDKGGQANRNGKRGVTGGEGASATNDEMEPEYWRVMAMRRLPAGPDSPIEAREIAPGGVKIALRGQAAALDLLWGEGGKQLDVRPVFVPSSGRVGNAHLNFDLPHELQDYQHVIVVVVDRQEIDDAFDFLHMTSYLDWARRSPHHVVAHRQDVSVGVGAARRTAQLIADELKIELFWMLDDDVTFGFIKNAMRPLGALMVSLEEAGPGPLLMRGVSLKGHTREYMVQRGDPGAPVVEITGTKMTLLNQRLARQHDVYFDDCHVEPGAEWAAFIQKLSANAKQEPALANSLEVDFREGLLGGWATVSELVPAATVQGATKDPLLKVMRRLDQGGEVRRVERAQGGMSKVQIVGTISDFKIVSSAKLHGEGIRILSASSVAEGTESSEPAESALGASFAVEAGGELSTWTATGGPLGQTAEDAKEDDCGPKEAGLSPALVTAASPESELRAIAGLIKVEVLEHFLMLLPGGLPLEGILARQQSEAARKTKVVSSPQGNESLSIRYQFGQEVQKVIVNGEGVPLWEGDESTLAAAVVEAYGAPPSWRVWDPLAPKEVAASFPVLEAALELFELLVVAAKRIWVLGADNRALSGPLAPPVKALGKSLGRSMSPVVFWHAATTGAELIDLCKKMESTLGLAEVLTVLAGLKYVPDLGARLVKPQLGSVATVGGEGGSAGPEADRKGKGPEGSAEVVAAKKQSQSVDAKPGAKGTGVVAKPGGDQEPGRTMSAAAAAYEYLAQTGVHEWDCVTLGEKLAVVGARSSFNEPETRGTTFAGLHVAASLSNLLTTPQNVNEFISGCVVAPAVHPTDVHVAAQALIALTGVTAAQVPSKAHRALLWHSTAVVMTLHKDSDSIQRSGCAILHNLQSCPDSPEADVMARATAIAAMTRFPSDVRIQFLGGKILCQAGGSPWLAVLGGMGALAHAMRVCGTSQEFQTEALRQMLPLLIGYNEQFWREGEAAAARIRKGVQRQGLTVGAAFATLRAARKVFAGNAMDKLNALAKWVLEHRPGLARESPLESDVDVIEALSGRGAKEADLGEGLGTVLRALETFPKSLQVQRLGLGVLYGWVSERTKLGRASAPAEDKTSETVQGVFVTAKGGLAVFGGAAQYPCPLSFFDESTGVQASIDTPESHLLLSRALKVAAAALGLVIDDEAGCKSALLALAQLLKVLGTLFDAAGFLNKQKKLRRVAAGEQPPAPSDGIVTRVVGEPSGEDPDMDEFIWDREASVLALTPVNQAFSKAVTVLQEWFERPASGNLYEEAVAVNSQAYAALPGAFCRAFESLCQRFWREACEREKERNVSQKSPSDICAADVPRDGKGLEAAEACVEDLGTGEKAWSESDFVGDEEEYFFECARTDSGAIDAVQSALKPFGMLLTLADDSETVIEVASGLQQLYTLGGLELFTSETSVPEGFVNRLTRQPCGADWAASGMKAIFQSLSSYARPCRRVGGDQPAELQRRAEVVEALIGALGAGLSFDIDYSLINRGVAEALCTDPPAMKMLVELLGWELAGQAPLGQGHDLPLNENVSNLFAEFQEVFVHAAGVGVGDRGPPLVGAVLLAFAREDWAYWEHYLPSYCGSFSESSLVATRVMLHVLSRQTASDGSLNRPELLSRILALRSSGAFDSAPVIAAVETTSGSRVFRAPVFEGLVIEKARVSEGEKLLYYCDFLHYEQQVRRFKALPADSWGREVEPLDRESFELEIAGPGTLFEESRIVPTGTDKTRGATPPWDRAFWTLTGGKPYVDRQLLWASLVADVEHGARSGVELLDELAYREPRYDVSMASQVYGFLRHQLRTGSAQWVAEAERAELCWAVTRGVWERELGEVELRFKRGGALLKEGCALLVALIETVLCTARVERLPERFSGSSSELGLEPSEKVWLARLFVPDLLKVYGACGKLLETCSPAEGIPAPTGGCFYEGPGVDATDNTGASRIAREVRAAARRGLLAAQWLHEETGGGGWFPGTDKLLLTHDAAAEGDFESLWLATEASAAIVDGRGKMAAFYRDFCKQPVLLPGEQTAPDWMPKDGVVQNPASSSGHPLQKLMDALQTVRSVAGAELESRGIEKSADKVRGGGAGGVDDVSNKVRESDVQKLKGTEQGAGDAGGEDSEVHQQKANSQATGLERPKRVSASAVSNAAAAVITNVPAPPASKQKEASEEGQKRADGATHQAEPKPLPQGGSPGGSLDPGTKPAGAKVGPGASGKSSQAPKKKNGGPSPEPGEARLGYLAGTGVAEWPERALPFRVMPPELAVKYFSQHPEWTDRIPFTLDLLRSPPEHFKALCEYLRKPRCKFLREAIGELAAGLLLERDHALRTLFRLSNERLVAGEGEKTRDEMRHEWVGMIMAVATTRAAYVRCICDEALSGGQEKGLDALRIAYDVFMRPKEFDRTDAGVVLRAREMLDGALAKEQTRVGGAKAEQRDRVRERFAKLRAERPKVEALLEELERGFSEVAEGGGAAGSEKSAAERPAAAEKERSEGGADQSTIRRGAVRGEPSHPAGFADQSPPAAPKPNAKGNKPATSGSAKSAAKAAPKTEAQRATSRKGPSAVAEQPVRGGGSDPDRWGVIPDEFISLAEMRETDFLAGALGPEDEGPVRSEEAREYCVGSGVAEVVGCPVPFRKMTPPEAHAYLLAHCGGNTWWSFTWDLLRSPPAFFGPVSKWLDDPKHDEVGETVRSMALGALRIRENALRASWESVKQGLPPVLDEKVKGGLKAGWLATLKKIAVARGELIRRLYDEVRLYKGRRFAGVLPCVRTVFSDESLHKGLTLDRVEKCLEWIDGVGDIAKAGKQANGEHEWIRRVSVLLRAERPGVERLLAELVRGGSEEYETAVWPSAEDGAKRQKDALAALSARNFAEEASGLFEHLLPSPDAETANAFAAYIRGESYDRLPLSEGSPCYRAMAPQGCCAYLLAHCDARTWWLFTLDLLRSQPDHYNPVCACLHEEEGKAIAAPVRRMAVGALRLRASEMSQTRKLSKSLYNYADEHSLPAGKRFYFRQWMRWAASAAVARAILAACLRNETKGEPFSCALELAYEEFSRGPVLPGEFVRSDLEDAHQKAVSIARIEDEPGARERVVAAAGEENRAWLEWAFEQLEKEKRKLEASLDELQHGMEVMQRGQDEEPLSGTVAPSRINVPVIAKWVEAKMLEGGARRQDVNKMRYYLEDEIDDDLEAFQLQLQLEGSLGRKGVALAAELWALLVSAQEAPDGIPRQLKEAAEQAAAELLKGESGADKKAAKKAKKKHKKKKAEAVDAQDPSRASTPPGNTQTAPSETTQSNESAAAVIEPPPVLKGRDFITETGGSLDKIRPLGAGAEELTSAYVMGLSSAQPPGRLAEWCELAPAGVREYLLAHQEEGTWWVFTLDLIHWPAARFSAMAEFLGRTENGMVLRILSSMAVAALRIRTTELRNRAGILRDGCLELPDPIDRRMFDRAIDATAGLWAPGVSRKVAEGKLVEAWLRFAIVAVQGTEALCAFFLKKAIDPGFSDDLRFVWATLSNKLSSIRSPPEVDMSVLNGLASGLRESEEALRKLLVWFPRQSSIEGHVASPYWTALLAQELQHAKALLPQLEFVIATQWRLTSYQTGLVTPSLPKTPAIMKWVAEKATELQRTTSVSADDVIALVKDRLADKYVWSERLHFDLTSLLHERAPAFMGELWAQLSTAGVLSSVPRQVEEDALQGTPALASATWQPSEGPSPPAQKSHPGPKKKKQSDGAPSRTPEQPASSSPVSVQADPSPAKTFRTLVPPSAPPPIESVDDDGDSDVETGFQGRKAHMAASERLLRAGEPESDSGCNRQAAPSVRAVELTLPPSKNQSSQEALLAVTRAPLPNPESSPVSPEAPVDSQVRQLTDTSATLSPESKGGGPAKSRTCESAAVETPTSRTQSEPSTDQETLGGSPSAAGTGGVFMGQTETSALNLADSTVASQRQTPTVPERPVPAPLAGTGPISEVLLTKPPSKPRAPYNPLAMTRPQRPTSSSDASVRSRARSAPTNLPESRPESTPQKYEVLTTPMSKHGASITGQSKATFNAETVATDSWSKGSKAGPGEQRPPEPGNGSPDLSAILSLLLPAEDKRSPKPSPEIRKPVSLPTHEAAPSSAPEAQGVSHVAAPKWLKGNLGAAGAAEPLPAHIRAALEIYTEQNGKPKPTSAARKAAKQELRDDDTCCVCFERPKNAALVPCGHRLCFECSKIIQGKRGDCPLCNTRMDSVLKLFN